MALLTAEDVLNKKFQATRMREGYDQDEVDDFLDEVVETFAKYEQENHELKARLAAAERRVAELENAPAAEAPMAQEPQEPFPAAEPAAQEEPVASEPVQPPAEPVQESAAMTEPESATGMLALAQKLHDDYVRAGNEEHDRIVGDARSEAERMVAEAKQEQDRTRTELEQERSVLERKIDELRVFERDYRTRMRSYLENLLSEVDSKGSGNSGGSSLGIH